MGPNNTTGKMDKSILNIHPLMEMERGISNTCIHTQNHILFKKHMHNRTVHHFCSLPCLTEQL